MKKDNIIALSVTLNMLLTVACVVSFYGLIRPSYKYRQITQAAINLSDRASITQSLGKPKRSYSPGEVSQLIYFLKDNGYNYDKARVVSNDLTYDLYLIPITFQYVIIAYKNNKKTDVMVYST